MALEEKELCLNGFCRTQNQGRMVLIVLTGKEGKWELDDVDCEYLGCPNRAACEIAKQIDAEISED